MLSWMIYRSQSHRTLLFQFWMLGLSACYLGKNELTMQFTSLITKNPLLSKKKCSMRFFSCSPSLEDSVSLLLLTLSLSSSSSSSREVSWSKESSLTDFDVVTETSCGWLDVVGNVATDLDGLMPRFAPWISARPLLMMTWKKPPSSSCGHSQSRLC